MKLTETAVKNQLRVILVLNFKQTAPYVALKIKNDYVLRGLIQDVTGVQLRSWKVVRTFHGSLVAKVTYFEKNNIRRFAFTVKPKDLERQSRIMFSKVLGFKGNCTWEALIAKFCAHKNGEEIGAKMAYQWHKAFIHAVDEFGQTPKFLKACEVNTASFLRARVPELTKPNKHLMSGEEVIDAMGFMRHLVVNQIFLAVYGCVTEFNIHYTLFEHKHSGSALVSVHK